MALQERTEAAPLAPAREKGVEVRGLLGAEWFPEHISDRSRQPPDGSATVVAAPSPPFLRGN